MTLGREARNDKLRNERGQIWLNVASSVCALEGFVNLDNHILMLALEYPILLPFVPQKNRDMLVAYQEASRKAILLRHDCRKRLPLPDGSVDHILCSHFLEHVYPDEAEGILGDFWRALKPSGSMHIIVPDLEGQIRTYLKRRRNGSTTAADEFVRESLLSTPSRGSLSHRMLELVGGFGLTHRWMYDYDSVRRRIEQLGFRIFECNDTPSSDFRKGDDSVHIIARKT
jgi:predicted SAM-dependent methyltransferase